MVFANLEKINKMAWLRNAITQAGKLGLAVDEEKIIYEMGNQLGTSRRTAMEYLKGFAAVGLFIREDGKIYLAENYRIIKKMDKELENAE